MPGKIYPIPEKLSDKVNSAQSEIRPKFPELNNSLIYHVLKDQKTVASINQMLNREYTISWQKNLFDLIPKLDEQEAELIIKGVLSHELSHAVRGDFRFFKIIQSSMPSYDREKACDLEAINRGCGEYLYGAAVILGKLGLPKQSGYLAEEIKNFLI